VVKAQPRAAQGAAIEMVGYLMQKARHDSYTMSTGLASLWSVPFGEHAAMDWRPSRACGFNTSGVSPWGDLLFNRAPADVQARRRGDAAQRAVQDPEDGPPPTPRRRSPFAFGVTSITSIRAWPLRCLYALGLLHSRCGRASRLLRVWSQGGSGPVPASVAREAQ
jgi:hypothetical protein